MMQQWALVPIVMIAGCELGVEQLEGGDGADELESGDETDANGDGDGDGDGDGGDGDGDGDGDGGDGDGDGEAANACVVQGTNLGGGSEPLDHPLPACEVECATGWGHDAPPLDIEWTLDLGHDGPNTGFTHLLRLPDDELVALIGGSDAPPRMVWISPDGELIDELTQPAIDGYVWDVDVDASGTIYAIWQDDDVQALSAMSSGGEHLWTVELGPYTAYQSTIAAMEAGVMVALNPADNFEPGQLLRVSAAGGVTSMGPIALTLQIAVSPSGDTVALASTTTISWTNFDLFPTWTGTQGVADAQWVHGLVALDDETVASVGAAKNWDEQGLPHGYIKQIGQMGLAWEGRYDRATAWCGTTEGPTDEVFTGIARLSDGSLFVTGGESGGSEGTNYIIQQPIVLHVSADGEVLGTDRGFWPGLAATAVAGSDGSAFVLMYEFDDSDPQQGNQHLHVRKYAP
ncbi:MAG TPA: hypothetical protein VM869_37330 [Enhygromyxa sp.]|nr:hypothetical protein [Enhygromyxa sp.]